MAQATATITTATDTELIAACESGQHYEVYEYRVACFATNASSTFRAEDAAGGNVYQGLGAAEGATAIGEQINRQFNPPLKLTEAKGISIETVNTATWYVYCSYRLVPNAG